MTSGSGSGAGASDAASAFRATAALRRAFVYWRQWGLHIRPRPSFWLGWTGKSLGSASWASMPKRVEPMQRRVWVSVVMVVVSFGRSRASRRDASHESLGMRPDATSSGRNDTVMTPST